MRKTAVLIAIAVAALVGLAQPSGAIWEIDDNQWHAGTDAWESDQGGTDPNDWSAGTDAWSW
jgi:hypothetical protein